MSPIGYMCSLNDADIKHAKSELNEDPATRLEAVKKIRDWILTNGILCNTDTSCLLKFLRVAHFDQSDTCQYIQNYVAATLRRPEWYSNLDVSKLSVQAVLNTGCLIPLPQLDNQGRKVLLVRLGATDPNSKLYDKNDIFRTTIIVLSSLLQNESIQVRGVVFLMDLANFGIGHQTLFTPSELKSIVKAFQKAFPIRIRAIHFINNSSIFAALFEVVKLFMSQKMRKRITFHGTDFNTLHQDIPPKMIPFSLSKGECDVNTEAVADLLGAFKEELNNPEFRQRLLTETTQGSEV